jgi:cytochrome c peroxidase
MRKNNPMNRTTKCVCRSLIVSAVVAPFLAIGLHAFGDEPQGSTPQNERSLIQQGRQTFRFDTFGDEAFWGDTLKLHEAIEGSAFGGVGPGLSPAAALAVGLKVGADALPQTLVADVQSGKVDLNSPATTLALLKSNAVVGLTGFFNSDGSLKSVGIQCALCHSTVDASFQAPGVPAGNIGHRLDGWANRDLNVGAIVNLSPDLSAPAKLLGVDESVVRKVLLAWGPGKFDAELFMDGKAFRPDGATAAVLIPPAYGLAGVNLHTWTGWGSVTYWNAFVANLEMHGKGRFFDSRLNNQTQFPIAAANGFGNVTVNPADDRITPKLAALHAYQLSIPAPKSTTPFGAAAQRGEALFNGKAQCARCHVPPLFTEPGWNAHPPADVCIDSFQADRAPDHVYRTAPLGGLFAHQKGGFYHDGRFRALSDVINHYDACMNLQLADQDKSDLVQYLLAL